MFPQINAEVKSALRWYRDPLLRNRHTARCKDEGDCTYAVWMPSNLVMPFQLVAGLGAQFGQSTPTSWKVYDINGTLIQDLSAHLGSLAVMQFSNPNRDYIMLESELYLTTPLTGSLMEMEITTVGGTYYSETFRPMCGAEMTVVDNPEIGWLYADIPGLVTGVLVNDAALPSSPALWSRYLIVADGTVRTWTGSSYSSASAVDGRYYTALQVGGFWYLYTTAGGVVGVASPPVYLSPMPCWNGTFDAGVSFEIPDIGPEMQQGRVDVAFTGLSGTFDLQVNSEHVAFISSTPSSTVVTISPGDQISLVPVDNAEGCLSKFQVIIANGGGRACYHKLSWRSCGDIGTHRYKYNSYRNTFYFPVEAESFIGSPSPKFKVENEEGENGKDIPIFTRKDTDWRIDIAECPWWLLDALTEIPLHDDVQLTLQGRDVADQIEDVRVNYDWSGDACNAKVDIEFRVDDPTIATGCCGAFDPICLEACGEVDGVEGVDDLVVGNYYARSEARQFAQYLGPDAEVPVDGQYFAYSANCSTGLLQFTDFDRPYVYWTGSAWAVFVTITQVLVIDDDTLFVKAEIAMPVYGGQVQYTINGTDWINTGAVYSSEAMASGVNVDVPLDVAQIRVMAVGSGCNIAFSAPHYAFPFNPDGFNGGTQRLQMTTNGALLVAGSFTASGATSLGRIAKLDADGSLNAIFTFNSGTGFNNEVVDMKLQADGKIVCCGKFTSYNGNSCGGIARINADGTFDTTFNAGGSGIGTPASNWTGGLEILDDGTIVMVGVFTVWNGVSGKGYIVALDPTGAISTTFLTGTGFDNLCFNIKKDGAGNVIVTGMFNVYKGVSTLNVIRINSVGTKDTTFTWATTTPTGIPLLLSGIDVQADGEILLVGNITQYGGVTVPGVLRIANDGTLDTAFNTNLIAGGAIPPLPGTVKYAPDGRIFVCGKGMISIDPDGTTSSTQYITSITDTSAVIRDLNIRGDGLAVTAGTFITVNGLDALRIYPFAL